jgi:hypothetical protein
MSEEKSFMQRLDAWTDEVIIDRLLERGASIGVETQLLIRRAVREKVLESHRNGQTAGPGPERRGQERRPMSYGR